MTHFAICNDFPYLQRAHEAQLEGWAQEVLRAAPERTCAVTLFCGGQPRPSRPSSMCSLKLSLSTTTTRLRGYFAACYVFVSQLITDQMWDASSCPDDNRRCRASSKSSLHGFTEQIMSLGPAASFCRRKVERVGGVVISYTLLLLCVGAGLVGLLTLCKF